MSLNKTREATLPFTTSLKQNFINSPKIGTMKI